MDKNEECKIQELLAELSESHEDERTTQNQILQIISILVAVLGILFGTSTIIQNTNSNKVVPFATYINALPFLTPARIIFWLSAIAFVVTFLYVTYLGILNLLRYYHIQNIEDRLHTLIVDTKDNNGRGCLLHWNEYSAPITTKNFMHITCSHTFLSFLMYIGSIMFIIIFSIGMVFAQFLNIDPIKKYDVFVLLLIIFIMVFVLFLFCRLSCHASEVAQYSWNIGHKNQDARLKGQFDNMYKRAVTFRYMLRYLIYPKIQDLQKPCLIVAGFLFWIVYSQITVKQVVIPNLVLLLFVFDFLVYQARYQINDIRGIKEDKEANQNNRLRFDNNRNMGHVIKCSLFVAFAKILIAIFISWFLGPEPRWFLILFIGIVFVSTVAYEIAKNNKWNYAIFVLVGCGFHYGFS